MKKANISNPQGFLSAPAYPHTGPQLFAMLRLALNNSLGFQPSFERLGRMIGQKTNLTHYWFRALPHTHLIAFLSLLEHLPERRRTDLLNEYCRELPSLESSRLAHDPLVVSQLEKLLGRTTGLTLVRGGTEFQRTFVLTALGHSLPRTAGPKAKVVGIDVHEPLKWVPVEGITYFKDSLSPGNATELVERIWPDIRSSTAPLVLLNSIWSLAPGLQPEILTLAQKRHLVIADAKLPSPAILAGNVETPLQVININSVRSDERLLRLDIETA